MKKPSKLFTRILTILGAALLLGSAVSLVVTRFMVKEYTEDAAETVRTLQALMPSIVDSTPDGRTDVTMPTAEVKKQSFAGIIEIPAYDRTLPLYGKWDKRMVTRFPCRYLGSMYDSSLIIGGCDNEGQFDFIKRITGGDAVYVTDMTGTRYAYVVTDIMRTKDISTENLTKGDSDLTLFARDSGGFDYIIVCCQLKNNIQ